MEERDQAREDVTLPEDRVEDLEPDPEEADEVQGGTYDLKANKKV